MGLESLRRAVYDLYHGMIPLTDFEEEPGFGRDSTRVSNAKVCARHSSFSRASRADMNVSITSSSIMFPLSSWLFNVELEATLRAVERDLLRGLPVKDDCAILPLCIRDGCWLLSCGL